VSEFPTIDEVVAIEVIGQDVDVFVERRGVLVEIDKDKPLPCSNAVFR
jgi:hypothetical protein